MQQVGNEGVLVVSFPARSNVQQCLNLLAQSLEESPKGGACSPQEQPQNGWMNVIKKQSTAGLLNIVEEAVLPL
jgi:hypothetical protein